MIIYLPRLPKYFIYPFLIMVVSTPFIIANLVYQINTLHFHLIGIAIVILFQVYMARRSSNTCGTCGHERHMHDKKDLIKKGFQSLTKVICDDFKKGKWQRNYERKYWNGEDTIEWDTSRDK